MNILSLENITHSYTERKLFDEASFYLHEGEKVGIIGINGTGKSTLLKIMAGFEIPDEGQVIKAANMMIHYLPQNPIFNEEDTVLESVQNMIHHHANEDELVKAKAMMTRLGITDFEQKTSELSGGQRKRLALVSVLITPCDILILDEPTAGLDPAGRDKILNCIENLHKKKGMAVVLVSHSMEDVANYAERIIVMNNGSVMFDDTPKKVFKHYKELEKIGLAAPQITYIMHQLKENGLDVDENIINVEEAKENILKALGK